MQANGRKQNFFKALVSVSGRSDNVKSRLKPADSFIKVLLWLDENQSSKATTNKSE